LKTSTPTTMRVLSEPPATPKVPSLSGASSPPSSVKRFVVGEDGLPRRVS
jgi:hypothetical protein